MKRSLLVWNLLVLGLLLGLTACDDPSEDGYGSKTPEEDGDDQDDDDDDDDDDDNDDNDDEYQELTPPEGLIRGTILVPEPPRGDERNFSELQLYLLADMPAQGEDPVPVNHDTLQNFVKNEDETARVFSYEFPYLADGEYYLYVWIDLNRSHEPEEGETFLYESGVTVENGGETEGPQWSLPITED